jgi:hypothetical protein
MRLYLIQKMKFYFAQIEMGTIFQEEGLILEKQMRKH